MAGKPPDGATLYQAALNHLARYAATEAGLARVLARRLDRWARLDAGAAAEPEEILAQLRQASAEIPEVIARLRAAGLVDDGAFAVSRAKKLTRAGKSRRAVLAHLAAKGTKMPVAEDAERELAAACAYMRRRRAGPFGDAPADKILAAMARGGFSQATARQALAMDREEAEGRIKTLQD